MKTFAIFYNYFIVSNISLILIVKPKGLTRFLRSPLHIHPPLTFLSQINGIAKLRLIYSSDMALILLQLKDITNFVLGLICLLFTLFIKFVCLFLCLWLSQVFEVIRTRLSIKPYIGLISGVILTPHTNRVKKLMFNIKWLIAYREGSKNFF